MKVLLLLLFFGLVVMGVPALAAQWNEDGDAPALPPGQMTIGDGSLDAINGNLGSDDADMYCVDIPTPSAFRATTCGYTSMDTQLWIFDENGMGISMDDDDPGGCGVQSTVTGRYVPSGGHYLLAVSSYDWDATNNGLEIWADTPYGSERQPDGPGAGGPVNGWSGTGYYTGAYTIGLTGAGFCQGTVPVETLTFGQIKAMYH